MPLDHTTAPISFAGDVRDNYPLPIAHEYGQLLEAEGPWDQCQQLKDVLDYCLRYSTLIALGDYFGGSLLEDPELKAALLEQFVVPKPDNLYRMLQMVMARYRDRRDELMVPELYDFCYTPEGKPTAGMRRVRRLLDAFVVPLDERHVGQSDVGRLQALHDRHKPEAERLLRDLSFLKKYELLRVDGTWPAGDGYTWQVKVLMGQNVPAESEKREGMPDLREHGVVLWDRDRGRVLALHPFALFDECEKCKEAFESPPEELFLYEKTAENSDIHYVGLREGNGLTHRIRTGATANDIRIVLQVEFWPLGVRLPEEAVLDDLHWWRYRGLAKTHSREQLEQYRKEKYRSSVYLRREMVEAGFQKFLGGEKNGFLVVGDSGTGKTSLLCHWVDNLLAEGEDVVLFYNCAELPAELAAGEEVNLGSVVAQRLGKHADFDGLLRDLDRMRGEGNGRFVLVLDALNEHQAPQALLESLWQDLLSQVPAGMYDWFKVVVSCRTEAWRRLEQHFRGIGQFYRTDDGVEVRLLQFTEDELPAVYGKYQQTYNLRTDLNRLTKTARLFIADPLMLRFVAEGYRGQRLPRDPRSVDIFDRYLGDKVGDKDDAQMDRLEKVFVSRLVKLMRGAGTDELSERALSDDEEIGQAVLASHSVNSPYFRLLDKGVVARVQVGRPGYGAAALFGGGAAEPETRVRFTYDRFFEYLLAFHVVPGPVTVDRVRELSAEATREGYASLWGALKMRLIAYAETESDALKPRGTLAELAQEEGRQVQSPGQPSQEDEEGYWLWRTAVRHEVRGLIVDTLVSYGSIQPEKVSKFLTDVLLQLGSEAAGLVAVFTAHRLRLPHVFEAAYADPSPIVRETAVQHTYFYWSRHREQGERYLSELAKRASREVLFVGSREIAVSKLRGQDFDLEKLPTLSAFLDTTLLIAGYFLTEPMTVRRFAQNILDLYDGFGPVKKRAVETVKRWAGDSLIDLWGAGGVVNIETLSIFTRRPLDDGWRQEVREFVPYIGLDPRPIEEMADNLMEWSRVKDGVVSLVLVGILTSRSIDEPEATLSLMKRMFRTGSAMSQYNVVRTMSSVLQQNLEPCPGYLEFFNEAILDIFCGSQTTVELEGREYGLGHLAWALTFECQRREHGRLEFVDQLLAQPWQDDPLDRLIHVVDELGTVGINAFKLAAVKPYPVLQTLSQWYHPEEMSAEEQERVQSAVARALARIWRAYPAEVEASLETEPEMMMRMYETMEREPHSGMTNVGAQGMTAIVFMPPALPGLVRIVETICDEVTTVERAVSMLGQFFLDPENMEGLAAWRVDTP